MSRTLHGRLVGYTTAMILGCCFASLTGCGKPTVEQPIQESLSQVAPGTPLSETQFATTLQATGAKYIVVQVFQEACGPCMTEALKLTQLEQPWQRDGVAILGMGMDATPEGTKAFFNSTGERIKYPLYSAPWFAEQQQVVATPILFIYSASGEQLYRTDPEELETSPATEIAAKLSELLASQ